MGLTRQQLTDKINIDIRNKTLPKSIKNINHADIEEELNQRIGDGGNEEYNDLASFPLTGDVGKQYLDKTTGLSYRWSGSAYVQIGSASYTLPIATDTVLGGVIVPANSPIKIDAGGNLSVEIDNGRIHYVSKGGDDATAQVGNPFKPYLTIGEAVDIALDGDVIYINPGDYNDNPFYEYSATKDLIFILNNVDMSYSEFKTTGKVWVFGEGKNRIGRLYGLELTYQTGLQFSYGTQGGNYEQMYFFDIEELQLNASPPPTVTSKLSCKNVKINYGGFYVGGNCESAEYQDVEFINCSGIQVYSTTNPCKISFKDVDFRSSNLLINNSNADVLLKNTTIQPETSNTVPTIINVNKLQLLNVAIESNSTTNFANVTANESYRVDVISNKPLNYTATPTIDVVHNSVVDANFKLIN